MKNLLHSTRKFGIAGIALLGFAGTMIHAEEPSTIWSASYKGELAKVQKFLRDDAKLLNKTPPEGEKLTPLEFAAVGGRGEVFKYLMSRGATFDKSTIMVSAASGGNLEIVRSMLAKGASVNGRPGAYWTPLSVSTRYPKVMEILLDKGANINATRATGMTALSQAVYHKHLPAVQLLLKRGANPNVGEEATLPILNAIQGKNVEMIRLLIAKGATVNPKWDIFDPEMKMVVTEAVKSAPQPKPQAAAPVSTDKNLAAQQSQVRSGEIALEGRFLRSEGQTAFISAHSFRLDNGRSGKIKTPKEKKILVTAETVIQISGKDQLLKMSEVSNLTAVWLVIGKDEGSGTTLTARRIMLLSKE